MALIWHTSYSICHLDSPHLSISCVCLYLPQLAAKHNHMRLVLYLPLTTGDCDYQVTH